MDDESTTGLTAGLLRRLAALFYDLLLVVALVLATGFALLPFTHGKAITHAMQGTLGYAYHAFMALVVYAYFARCWTLSGQTLGLKAWRLRLVAESGARIGWPGAAARFLLGYGVALLAAIGAWYLAHPSRSLAAAGAALLVAPLVLNFGWIPIDREGRSLVDLVCRSRVVRAP
jgi:uncharacterized RDD family membrane protein YckC